MALLLFDDWRCAERVIQGCIYQLHKVLELRVGVAVELKRGILNISLRQDSLVGLEKVFDVRYWFPITNRQ